MKSKKYLVVIFICFNQLYSFTNKSFMTYRSQGINLARSNAGWMRQCTDNNASLAVEYTQSFDNNSINNYYFGGNSLVFSGSRVADRGECDILADYFGLPTDFRSSLCFSPHIKNVITELDWYWLLGGCENRWNLRITMPIAYTKWVLNPCETVIDAGTLDYPAGYMSAAIITRDQLPNKALDVLSGNATFGDLIDPLQYGRICCGSQTDTKIADITVALGYNAVCTDQSLVNLNLYTVIPTGTVSNAVNLFEPQIGNGRHWALGGGLVSRYDFLERCDGDFRLSAHLDARVEHLFQSTQKRSYDFINNGAGSRYALMTDMVDAITNAFGFSPTPGLELLDKQYSTRLLYGIDASTLNSRIKIAVQGDLLAKLSASYQHWNFELGYNFWARSQEQLVCRDAFDYQYYALKGDAQVYGFLDIGLAAISIPSNPTQSQATLYAPQGEGNTTNNFVNDNADNPAPVYNVGQPIAQTTAASLVNTGATVLAQANGSDQAIVLTDADINNCSGLSDRALSQKIMGSLGYDYDMTCGYLYGLVGAEAEFAGKTDCVKTAISQWGVWIKGGINY